MSKVSPNGRAKAIKCFRPPVLDRSIYNKKLRAASKLEDRNKKLEVCTAEENILPEEYEYF